MRGRSAGFGLFAVLAVIVLCLARPPAAPGAEPLAAPTGPVVLTVTGAISRTNAPGKAEFDLAMLDKLGGDRITTTTNWTDGKVVFEGPAMRKVLEATGATGKTIIATALDEYTIDIPVEDFERYDVLLAMRMNGKALEPSFKGPLWIVYPRDDHPELRDPTYNARWVWQLRKIEVK